MRPTTSRGPLKGGAPRSRARRFAVSILLVSILATGAGRAQQESFLSLPAADFSPRGASDEYVGNESGTNRFFKFGSQMFAAVHLPDGATVTGMRCGGRANSTQFRVRFALQRSQPGIEELDLAEVTTTFEGVLFQHPVTDVISHPVIDNRNFDYSIRVTVEQEPALAGLCGESCLVGYCRIGFVPTTEIFTDGFESGDTSAWSVP